MTRARKVEEIAQVDRNDPLGGVKFTHPAFAQIGASRISGSACLYGSDFFHHNFIRIRIAQSEMTRSLSNDWPSEKTLPYIEVDLSEAQWASFVSSLNNGSGTLCTLRYKDGIEIPELPDPKSRKDQFKEEAKKTCGEALSDLQNLIAEIDNLKLSQAAKNVLKDKAERAKSSLLNGLPYVLDQFGEHVESTVEKAKVEVNAYATQYLIKTGLATIEAKSQLPVIEFKE